MMAKAQSQSHRVVAVGVGEGDGHRDPGDAGQRGSRDASLTHVSLPRPSAAPGRRRQPPARSAATQVAGAMRVRATAKEKQVQTEMNSPICRKTCVGRWTKVQRFEPFKGGRVVQRFFRQVEDHDVAEEQRQRRADSGERRAVERGPRVHERAREPLRTATAATATALFRDGGVAHGGVDLRDVHAVVAREADENCGGDGFDDAQPVATLHQVADEADQHREDASH